MIQRADTFNEQAYDIIKEKIINKELQPGSRLVDSQLASDFGISRTPIRDAIRKLSEEGLVVTNSSKKGYFVFQPSFRDINEIFELRRILDIAAVTKLITQILPSTPNAFEELKTSYERSIYGRDAAFVKEDEDFHDTIIRLAGNSYMLSIYIDLRNRTRAFRSATSKDSQRMEKAKNYHDKIFNGLMSLNLEMTISAVTAHVEFSRIDAISDYSTK